MKLCLLRHGITRGNKENLCYGSTDLPLLEEGVAELRRRAEKTPYPVAGRYYTSGMLRTEQTFALLYGDQPHQALPQLREISFGRFEMIPFAALQDDPDYRRWADDAAGGTACPGGESFLGVQNRALQGIAPVLAAGEDAVCVIHGGVIACMMTHWFPGRPFDYWMPHPGTGWQVTVEDGRAVSYEAIPEE